MIIDLKHSLESLCAVLGIEKPPTIEWMDKTDSRFVGTYNAKRHRIEISKRIDPNCLDLILVHELCHCVLDRVGYRSAGHSAIFLATNNLMQVKAGIRQQELIEHTAIANWNKWTPWPIWYRHIIRAQELYEQMVKCDGFIESSSAQSLAKTIVNAESPRKWVPLWVAHRWYEIIADVRGNWFALWQLSRVSFFLSIGLICTPWQFLQKVGFVIFALTCICLGVVSKVFKLDCK